MLSPELELPLVLVVFLARVGHRIDRYAGQFRNHLGPYDSPRCSDLAAVLPALTAAACAISTSLEIWYPDSALICRFTSQSSASMGSGVRRGFIGSISFMAKSPAILPASPIKLAYIQRLPL